jgi:hypothetical protein
MDSSGDGEKTSVVRVWGSVRNAMVGSFAAVIFGVMILLASVISAADPVRVYPSNEGIQEESIAVTVAASNAAAVEYYLPYPGMLPDNVFYKLKAVRDRILFWLTFDEEKKASRELGYADKRINAAAALADGGKEDLAVSTATKAEKYLESSINRAMDLSKNGKDVKSLMLTLEKAAAKHEEVLVSLQGKVEGASKPVLEKTLETTRILQQLVRQALLESK